MMSNMGKRDHGEVDEAGEDEELKRQKQDEGNIDAALLNEVGDDEHHHGDEERDSHYDTTAAAVANAAYSDLIQHPGEGRDEKQLGAAGKRRKSGEDDEDEDEEDEEEEEDLDDQIKDPDHIPEAEGVGYEKRKGLEEEEEDEDDESKKLFGGVVGNGRRGRKSAPTAGSDEWKRQRKDSHKEVERRRRENINTAINKLSELLPVRESSKATILARAAEYIQKLKETESANIDKWTLQKLLSEQNQSRLTSANERLQDELGKAYKEIEELKHSLKQAGLPYDMQGESHSAKQGALNEQ